MTRGRVLLRAVAAVTTCKAIAARCAVSRSCVSLWLSGRTEPSPSAVARIERAYGIPAATWSEDTRRSA